MTDIVERLRALARCEHSDVHAIAGRCGGKPSLRYPCADREKREMKINPPTIKQLSIGGLTGCTDAVSRSTGDPR